MSYCPSYSCQIAPLLSLERHPSHSRTLHSSNAFLFALILLVTNDRHFTRTNVGPKEAVWPCRTEAFSGDGNSQYLLRIYTVHDTVPNTLYITPMPSSQHHLKRSYYYPHWTKGVGNREVEESKAVWGSHPQVNSQVMLSATCKARLVQGLALG